MKKMIVSILITVGSIFLLVSNVYAYSPKKAVKYAETYCNNCKAGKDNNFCYVSFDFHERLVGVNDK